MDLLSIVNGETSRLDQSKILKSKDIKDFKDESVGHGYANLLDQSKRKLTSLDSQRIVSIFTDFTHKCELVTLFLHILENLQQYRVMLGPVLVKAFEEYNCLLNCYTDILERIQNFRTPSEIKVLEAESLDEEYVHKEELNTLRLKISDNIMTIVRLFRLNQAAFKAIIVQKERRSSEANDFINTLCGLREKLFSRLVSSAAEEQDKLRITVELWEKEKKANVTIKKLESELAFGVKEKKEMIKNHNDQIRKLKNDIQSIEQENEHITRKTLNDAKKIEASDIKNSEVMQGKLHQDVITSKQQLQGDVTKHREDELAMRKRKFKIETEVENWLQKYDSDMTEKQDEFDDISARYAEEKNQLEQLNERFISLEVDYDRIVEEKRIAREKMEKEEEDMRRMVKAATLLQSFYRSYRCRKMLKASQKKGKKGKGGRKKKK